MTGQDSQVTATEYEPDTDLTELIESFERRAIVSYEGESDLDISIEGEAVQRDYSVTFEDFELSGTETMSPLGVLLSFQGNFGLSAAVILSHARIYGVPTQIYTDEVPPPDPISNIGLYQDVTAEWYHQEAVRQGVPEARMKHRSAEFQAEMLGLGTIEQWARVWLSRE